MSCKEASGAPGAPTYRPFDASNAFIDNGWAGVLTRVQTAVWLTFWRRANKDGIAWPGTQMLANNAGVKSLGGVRAARKKLVAYGLLALVKPGSVAGKRSGVYRVLVPPSLPPELVAGSDTKQHRPESPTRLNPDRQLVAGSDTQENNEVTIEEPINMSVEDGRAGEDVSNELRLAGVTGTNLATLAATPGLTPFAVRALAIEARRDKTIGNPPGWIVQRIKTGTFQPPPLSPEVVSALVNNGHVVAVSGPGEITLSDVLPDPVWKGEWPPKPPRRRDW